MSGDDDDRHRPIIDPLGRFAVLVSAVGSKSAARGIVQTHREAIEQQLSAVADAFATGTARLTTADKEVAQGLLTSMTRSLHDSIIASERRSPAVGVDLAGVVLFGATAFLFSSGQSSVGSVEGQNATWLLPAQPRPTASRPWPSFIGGTMPFGRLETEVTTVVASPQHSVVLLSPEVELAPADVMVELVQGFSSDVAAAEILARDAQRKTASKSRAVLVASIGGSGG